MLPSVVVAASLFVVADKEKDAAALPAAWHGTWAGTMVITPAAGKPTDVPLVFKVGPLKGTPDLAWVMTYGGGEKAVVKDYKLVPADGKPGRFRIDEGNGVALDARLAGGVLYSQFEVGGNLLTARYELRGDVLRFEVTSAKPAEKTGRGQVQGYAVEVVQAAELRKK